MSQHSGIAVVDTNCLHHLTDAAQRDRVRSSLAMADFEIYPSVINAIEAAQAPASRRDGLLRVVAALAEGKGLLPQIHELLKRSGAALVAGDGGFWSGSSGLEAMLLEGPVTDEQAAALRRFTSETESRFAAMHHMARPQVMKLVKGRIGSDALVHAPTFLDRVWMTQAQQGDLLSHLWEHLGLSGSAPVEVLLAHPLWRAWLELEGVAVFERAVSLEQPKQVHQNDLRLASNLGLARRKLLITDDKPLQRVASSVFVGRYPQSRVLSWAEFEKTL